jgi:hypothetical protein
MADTTFEIDVKANGGQAASAAASLATLADEMARTEGASSAMAAEVAKSEAAYARAEKAADGASKALERSAVAAELNRTKLQAALEAGDEQKFWKLAGAARELEIQQGKLQARSDTAASALLEQATALEAVRVKADASATALIKAASASELMSAMAKEDAAIAAETANAMGVLANAFNQEAKAAENAARATVKPAKALENLSKATKKANKEPFNAKALSRDIDLLPGGIGKLASRALRAGDDIGGMVQQLGAGATAALGMAAGVIALTIAAAGLAAGAVIAGAGILKWAFALNPDNVTKMKTATDKWNATLKKTFGGLKFDKFFNLIDRLTNMFSTSEVSGRALKVVFESIFQPLLDQSEKLFPMIERGFLLLEIWALRGLIAIKPYGSKIALIAAGFGIMAGVIIGVVVFALTLLAAILVASAAGVVLIGEALKWVVGKAIEFGSAITAGVGQAIDWVTAKITGAIEFLRTLSLADIGKAMVDGLIAGITGAGGNILGALMGPLKGAVAGAKAFLGISSPAKLLADEVGAPMGQGVAGGVEGETAGIQGALTTAVTPDAGVKDAAAAAGAGAGGAPSSGAGAGTPNLAGATFIFQGVAGAEDAQGQFAELWFSVLSGDLAKLGAARRA